MITIFAFSRKLIQRVIGVCLELLEVDCTGKTEFLNDFKILENKFII